MHAYDFTFYSSSIAIQHVETARPYRTFACVHWSTVPYDFGHLSVAVRRLIKLIGISARPSDYQLVHRYSVCRFFSTSFRTSCSVRPSRFSTSILRHVDAARPSSSSTPALRYIVTNFFLGPSSSVQHVDSSARRGSSSIFDQCVSSSFRGQCDCNMTLHGRRIA